MQLRFSQLPPTGVLPRDGLLAIFISDIDDEEDWDQVCHGVFAPDISETELHPF